MWLAWLACQSMLVWARSSQTIRAGGGLFATDEPIVAEYLSGREPGVALEVDGIDVPRR